MEEKKFIEKDYEFLNCSEFKELDDYYSKPNYLKILNKHRSETAHSSFIAWLLDPKGSHNLGFYPLQLFIKLYNQNANANSKFFDYEQITEVEVRTEHPIKSNSMKNMRIDIFVSGKLKSGREFKLVIENKINSNENNNQTVDYYKSIQSDTDNCENNYYVYLKPFANILSETISSQEFIMISYQQFYDEVLVKVSDNKFNNTILFLIDYIESFSITDKDNMHLIVTIYEKEKYESIIDQYKEQIDKTIEHFDIFSKLESVKNKDSEKDTLCFLRLMYLIKYLHYSKSSSFNNEKIKEIIESTKDFTKYSIGLIGSSNYAKVAKNQILTELFKLIKIKEFGLEKFISIFPDKIGEKKNILFYHIYNNKEDFKKALKEKGKKNKFYYFSDPIIIDEHYIVMKKNWTARFNPDYKEKSSINFLIEYIRKNEDKFKVKIEPIE